jgi:hypothetical protein
MNKFMTTKEYRELLKDNMSSDEIIIKRLNYLEVFFRNIIKSGLRDYVDKVKAEKVSRG